MEIKVLNVHSFTLYNEVGKSLQSLVSQKLSFLLLKWLTVAQSNSRFFLFVLSVCINKIWLYKILLHSSPTYRIIIEIEKKVLQEQLLYVVESLGFVVLWNMLICMDAEHI